MQHDGEKAPRWDSNPRPLRSGVSEPLTTTLRASSVNQPQGESTFYSLCLTAQCASARMSRDDTDADVQPAPGADPDLPATGRG
eukprot:2344360-Prymnesium_polylepis.1